MPVPLPTPPITDSLDFSARLQQETRALASAYEREAYLVYNLALTTTCDAAAARRGAERGFLDAAARDVEDPAVVPSTVAAALAEAPQRPELPAAGDEHTALMLSAISALDPAERAAIAVQALCGADATGIGPVMGLTPHAGETLLERARTALATGLEIEPSKLDAKLDGILWSVPPDAIWESVFEKYYRAAEDRLRRAGAAAGDGEGPVRRLSGAGRLAGAGKWLAGTLAVAAIGVAATQLAASAGAGGAPSGSGADQGTAVAAPGVIPPTATTVPVPAASTTAPDTGDATRKVSPGKPLTARQLDELRMAELADLKRYAKRQADQRLTPQERNAAGREVERIRAIAARRLAAAQRRETRLRRELTLARLRARAYARARAQRKQEQRQPAAPAKPKRPRRPTSNEETTPPPQPTQDATTEQTPDSSEQAGCLYNESDGTYVCPDGNG